MLEHPTICVVGAGAVGGYYGARLAQAGNNVHFLLRSDYGAVQKSGWIIKSCDGDFALSPQAFGATDEPHKMPKADLVLVTLKTTANHRFEPLIGPLVKDDTAILTLQNGLGNEERLASLFGKERILGGMAFTCINRIAPGVIHHLAEGWIRIGEFEGGKSHRAERIAEIFNASGIETTVLDDLRLGRWEKLSWNVPFNGLGAAMDCTTDQLIDTAEGAALIKSIIEEVVAASAALGVTLPLGIAQKQLEKTRPMGAYQTSMQVDRREKREMEVEAILGEPLRRGKAAGVELPRMEMLYHMAKTLNKRMDR